MIGVRVIERVEYIRGAVPCMLFPICGSEAEFVWRASQWPPADTFRRRRCASCARAHRAAKRAAKIASRRARDEQMKEAGRLSVQREHVRREKQRRRRWRTVPKSIRTNQETTNGK